MHLAISFFYFKSRWDRIINQKRTRRVFVLIVSSYLVWISFIGLTIGRKSIHRVSALQDRWFSCVDATHARFVARWSRSRWQVEEDHSSFCSSAGTLAWKKIFFKSPSYSSSLSVKKSSVLSPATFLSIHRPIDLFNIECLLNYFYPIWLQIGLVHRSLTCRLIINIIITVGCTRPVSLSLLAPTRWPVKLTRDIYDGRLAWMTIVIETTEVVCLNCLFVPYGR